MGFLQVKETETGRTFNVYDIRVTEKGVDLESIWFLIYYNGGWGYYDAGRFEELERN